MAEPRPQGDAVLSSGGIDDALAEWVGEVAERIGSGEPADAEAFAAERPEYDEAIREHLPLIAALAGVELVTGGGLVLGDFRTIREVGRGGMGIVYEAWQSSRGRRVALKLLKPACAHDPSLVRRFRSEPETTARLEHPHIVPVYGSGAEGGRHFYAMKLIEGRTVEQIVEEGPLPSPDQAARWCRDAARALDYAHRNGIIHRDVKPSNLLVDANSHLWVADFGLARVEGNTTLTQTGAMLGTARYLSPEQARGVGHVDHRTDIYSLGATLYELLALQPTFDTSNLVELGRRIAFEEPLNLRRIDPGLPRDLVTIVEKAMSKDRAERYTAAADLADDLDRFLENRPIKARHRGVLYRTTKWAKRHKSAVAAMVVLLIVAIAWRSNVLRRHGSELQSARALADRLEHTTQHFRYGLKLKQPQHAWDSGKVDTAQQLLEALRPEPGQYDPRGFEWHYLRHRYHHVLYLPGHANGVQALAISRDGRTLASSDVTGLLILWDLERWRERGQAQTSPISSLWLSPDGATLASITRSATRPIETRIWDVPSCREKGLVDPNVSDIRFIHNVLEVAFTSDGRTLILPEPWWEGINGKESKGRVSFWDATQSPPRMAPGRSAIVGVKIGTSTDAQWIAVLDSSGTMTVREGETGKTVLTVPGRFADVMMMTPSRDGRTLAAVVGIWRLTFWDLVTGRELGSCESSRGGRGIFSPDGTRFLESWWDVPGEIRLHDVASEKQPIRVPLEGIFGKPWDSNFSPDGKLLAAGGIGLPATLWDAATGKRVATLPEKTATVRQVVFTADGQSLLIGTEDGRIRCWRFGEPTVSLAGHSAEVWSLAYTPDGSTLISSGDDYLIKIWDARYGRLKATLKGHDMLVTSLSVSPDGATLASVSFDRTVRLWDLPSGQLRAVLRGHTERVRAVAFSRDGRLIASSGSDQVIRVWNASSGELLKPLQGHAGPVRGLAFDPGGKLLISTSNDRSIRIWDLAGGEEPIVIPCSNHQITLGLSHDGSLLATGDESGEVTLWDVATWTRRMSFRGSDAPVYGLAFSPDGRTLAAACGDAKVRLWDPHTGQVTLVLDGHAQRVNAVAFSPDGRSLASASHDGAIKLWRAGPP